MVNDMKLFDLVWAICENKENILKLDYIELKKFKKMYYEIDIPIWQLDIIWEYLFDYLRLQDLIHIFKRSNMLNEVEIMKLVGTVLKRFNDGQDNNKTYAPIGTKDVEEYTGEETTYPSVYTAEKERYEQLQQLGYVSKGKMVQEKKNKFKIEKED